MDDALLTSAQRKADLSFSYLSALAAMAGYACDRGPYIDMDTVDATVRAGGGRRPVFDVQLKATSSPEWHGDGLHYRLDRRDYNNLREPRTLRTILVVLELPKNEADWAECTSESLILRRCAWWESLEGADEISAGSKTVIIPERQRFDLDVLRDIVARIRGRLPIKEDE